MKKYHILFCSLFYVFCLSQTARKYSNEFLSIGAGARAISMGGSVLTNGEDVYSPMWNPAGLLGISKDYQAAAMHAEYFESIAKYDYASFAKPIDNQSTFAFSLVRLGIDNIQNTTQLIDQSGNIDYSKISSFSVADYAGILSYAFHPSGNQNLAMGANAKIIYRNIGKFATGYGFGFDLGATYTAQNGWKYAAVLKDATSTVNFWKINEKELSTVVNGQEYNPAPENKMEISLPKLSLGVGKSLELNRSLDFVSEAGIAVDFAKTAALVSTDFASITPYIGAELGYEKLIFVRLGVNRFQNISDLQTRQQKVSFQPSAGLGIQYKGLTLDYAIGNSGISGSNFFSNFFSLKFDMNGFREN